MKTGRKKITIDWNKVDKYLNAQCLGTNIASILGIHPNTLYRACEEDKKMSFGDYSAQKKAEGVELLKVIQYQTALQGNVIMQIWLGKQYAGQRDKQDVAHEFPPEIKIEVANKENIGKLKDILNGKFD